MSTGIIETANGEIIELKNVNKEQTLAKTYRLSNLMRDWVIGVWEIVNLDEIDLMDEYLDNVFSDLQHTDSVHSNEQYIDTQEFDLANLEEPLDYGNAYNYFGEIKGSVIYDKQIFVLWYPGNRRSRSSKAAVLINFKNATINRMWDPDDTGIEDGYYCDFGYIINNKLVSKEEFLQQEFIKESNLKLWEKMAEEDSYLYISETESYSSNSYNEEYCED